MGILCRPRFRLAIRRVKLFSSQAMISRTSRRFLNRPRQGDLRIYTWRDASYPRLSGSEKICPLLWSLRHSLAEPAQGIPTVPGAILMTTNCLQKPQDSYKENIFTCGLVGWPGIKHIATATSLLSSKNHFSCPDFPGMLKEVSHVGFGRNTVLGVAGKVIEAVKNKQIVISSWSAVATEQSPPQLLHGVRRKDPKDTNRAYTRLRQVPFLR